MRRISSQYVQPGMVLCRDIYDTYGNVLIYQGTRLTLDNIEVLGRLGGGEVFIQDHRVDDIPVTPIIPIRVEGETTRQLRDFLGLAKASVQGGSPGPLQVNRLEKAVFSMVEQLYPVVMGEVNASGCFSLKDYDCAHPVQVAELALAMGRKEGMDENELTRMGIAAVLENVGYVALPAGVMEEPTTLTKIEMHEVQQHCQYGYQILKDHTSLSPEVLEIIMQHHERWDGSGYPRGLKKEAICREARIIAIADTYYALVSRRPHRTGTKTHEAIEYMMAYSGELFDPAYINTFLNLIQSYPTGVMVNLNTGESGIIVGARAGMMSRPVVRICYDKYQTELAKPFDMDLSESEHQHRLVTEVQEY